MDQAGTEEVSRKVTQMEYVLRNRVSTKEFRVAIRMKCQTITLQVHASF